MQHYWAISRHQPECRNRQPTSLYFYWFLLYIVEGRLRLEDDSINWLKFNKLWNIVQAFSTAERKFLIAANHSKERNFIRVVPHGPQFTTKPHEFNVQTTFLRVLITFVDIIKFYILILHDWSKCFWEIIATNSRLFSALRCDNKTKVNDRLRRSLESWCG